MASKLRSKALDAKDIKSEPLTIPAWDCTFEIRGLTGAQRAVLVEAATVTSKAVNDKGEIEETSKVDSRILNPLLVIASCFDPETGEKVFDDADAEGIENKSAEALDAITAVALRLNGMTKAEKKVLEKNSDAAIGDGTSGSPSTSA
jgi:hypothetical protein